MCTKNLSTETDSPGLQFESPALNEPDSPVVCLSWKHRGGMPGMKWLDIRLVCWAGPSHRSEVTGG